MGDYKKAAKEFDKLVRAYSNSKEAPKAQYYIGRCQENNEEYYAAFLAYQKAIDTYPHIENRDEIIKIEYDIGLLFYEGQKTKILGIELLPAMDKAVEIFEKVVANDRYGEYAVKAQFKIGESYNKSGQFAEGVAAFQKLIEEYPKSDLVGEAKYQVAYSTYRGSLGSDYDQEMTDEAIEEFEDFAKKHKIGSLITDADKVLDTLRERRAKSIFDIARFYERQRHFSAAVVYYKEIADDYSDTSVAAEALSKYTEVEKKARDIEEKKALRKARKKYLFF